MKTKRWSVAAALALGMMCSMSMAAPSRAERQQWQALANYLQMDIAQVLALVAQRGALDAELQHLAQQPPSPAQVPGRPQASGGGTEASAPELSARCQQAQQRVAAHRQRLLAQLSAPQLDRLQQLERAFALMPLIEAAQAAGMVSDRLALPPPGMPSGSVTVDHAWQRVLAPALPGCQGAGTRFTRELDLPDQTGPRKPPP